MWVPHPGDHDALSDEALLAGLGVGEADTGAAFVRRFQRRTFGLALSIVSDPGLAEDVAQEAMAKAWRHAQAYDPRRGSVATWLLTITRNLAIDALRLRRAQPTDPEVLVALDVPSEAGDPVEVATGNDDAGRIRAAIRRLPMDQRRALVLAVFHGRTAKEISATEAIPLGTAKTRIRSGLLKLRAMLVEQGAAP
ncbi:MAG: sigma-70 family RNA polymerase sigma factor [Actinobacteria bacterium]|nr:MAG: sigma-70 family RNA polymerase sigma factor [Actinomycetota bacterium]